MMFASKTPRDLNADPEPWHGNQGDRYAYPQECGREGAEVIFDPRPEYDHAQHNEPNWLLIAFREEPKEPGETDAQRIAWWLGIAIPDATEASEGESDHAHRVLSRLAHLTEQETHA